ncbi:hypothetical protein GCM10020331_098970 [Ectobacillus funiculus]
MKKDTDRGYQLCLLREGDVPLQQMLQLLVENGYDGYFTLEWEKKNGALKSKSRKLLLNST